MPKGYWIVRVDIADPEKYQEILHLRQPVSTIDLIIIEGYEGPQPE